LSAFEAALQKTASAKEQRQHIKSFLLSAGGDQLKALKPQKNTNVITNVTSMCTSVAAGV
jgi:exportin-5